MVALKCHPLSRVCSLPSHRTNPRSLLNLHWGRSRERDVAVSPASRGAPACLLPGAARIPGAGSPGLGPCDLVAWEEDWGVLVYPQRCLGQPLCRGCASPAGREGAEQAEERGERSHEGLLALLTLPALPPPWKKNQKIRNYLCCFPLNIGF